MTELLSPAGGREALVAAVQNGADAVLVKVHGNSPCIFAEAQQLAVAAPGQSVYLDNAVGYACNSAACVYRRHFVKAFYTLVQKLVYFFSSEIHVNRPPFPKIILYSEKSRAAQARRL